MRRTTSFDVDAVSRRYYSAIHRDAKPNRAKQTIPEAASEAIMPADNSTSRYRHLALLLVLLCNATQAGDVDRDIRPAAIRAHVEFLADDLLEGRGTSSRGYSLAAAYVAAQLRIAGLKPAGDRDGYLQSVPLLEATPVLPGSTVTWTHNDRSVAFEYGRDYLPGPDYGTATSTLTAPLAFAGYGITAPNLKYDDLANVDVRDRIAVVLSGAPRRFPPDRRAFFAWEGEKFDNLVRHGAAGVIVVDVPDKSGDARDKDAWDKRVAASWRPQMRWLNDDGQIVDAQPELKQRFRFNADAAEKLFVASDRPFKRVLDTAGKGQPQGFALPGTMTLSTTTGLRRTESVNVLGVVQGTDPELKYEYVVVTAHLDQLGRGAAVDGDAIYNGAHDNAVGVAMLLEIAHALAAAPAAKRSILFAAVTANEKGLLGSDYLVAQSPAFRQSLVADIDIDTPLTFAPTYDLIAFGAMRTSLGASVRRIAEEHGFRLKFVAATEDQPLTASDRFSFLRHGILSLGIVGGTDARNRRVDVRRLQQEYRASHRRQPSDDLSLPIDYNAAAALARINAAIVAEIANAASRPYFYRGSFFAERVGRF